MSVNSSRMINEEDNSSVLSIEQTFAAMDSLGDKIIIIDFSIEKILWYSKTFASCFPDFCEDVSLKKILKNTPCFRYGLDAIKEKYAKESKPIFIENNNKFFNLLLTDLGASKFMLNFKDLTQKADETQRYLEDREQLFSISRTLGIAEMATTLAHELNQPIGTLMNLLNGLRQRVEVSQKNQDEIIYAIDLAQQQTKFASDIIVRVRDYTRSRQPKYQMINVCDLVDSSLMLLDWEMQRDDVSLVVNFDRKEASKFIVEGDYVMLQQVLVNLLRNALDAMKTCKPGSATLKMDINKDGHFVDISICDNGGGLSKEDEENLFVPFISAKPNGTGIGLNICRSFIELHQGKLWLDSNKDKGCKAHVLLPQKM